MSSRPYVVQKGDHLFKLAVRFGFDADAVWQDAANKHLQDSGRDPHLLAPGDVLYIPEEKRKWLPVQAGGSNKFTVKVPDITVSTTLTQDGKPLANEKYTINHSPDKSFTTDGHGLIKVTVPATTEEVVVQLPRLMVILTLRIGDLDPVCTPSGALQRLRGLGHAPRASEEGERALFTAVGTGRDIDGNDVPIWPLDLDTEDVFLDDADILDGVIRKFQADAGIEPTGVLCKDTQNALVEKHGI